MPFSSVTHIYQWRIRVLPGCWGRLTNEKCTRLKTHFATQFILMFCLFVYVCVCLFARVHTHTLRVLRPERSRGHIHEQSSAHENKKSPLPLAHFLSLGALCAESRGRNNVGALKRNCAGATLENTIFLAPPHLHSATYLENPTNSEHIRMGGCTCALPWGLLTFFVRDVMLYESAPLPASLLPRLSEERISDSAVL